MHGVIDKTDLDAIRSLSDENLTTLISETNDGGWALAKRMLDRMRRTVAYRVAREAQAMSRLAHGQLCSCLDCNRSFANLMAQQWDVKRTEQEASEQEIRRP